MRIEIISFDTETNRELERQQATLTDFIRDNPNSPPQYVVREEIRRLGVYIMTHGEVRSEIRRSRCTYGD